MDRLLLAQTHWTVILNPLAGRGRAERVYRHLKPALDKHLAGHTLHVSQDEHDIRRHAARSVRAGELNFLIIGGDGSWHQLVNGVVDGLPPGRSPAAAGITCALCPFGTGNDWVRTHGLPRRPDAWLQHFLAARPRTQNLGILHYHDLDGRPTRRVFTNVAGLAYDAHVVRAAGAHAGGARWRYPLLTVTELPRYHPAPARLTYDGHVTEAAFHTVNFGIGRYSGGGMRLVPQADPTAETLALTYVPRLSIPRILLNGYRFYTGTIGGLGPVVTTHARTATVTHTDPARPVFLEADGEFLGQTPVRTELWRAALCYV